MDPGIIKRVVQCMEEVFESKGLPMPPVSFDTALDINLGLKSLDYAELLVRLEAEFGIDPFNKGITPTVGTVGELAQLYE